MSMEFPKKHSQEYLIVELAFSYATYARMSYFSEGKKQTKCKHTQKAYTKCSLAQIFQESRYSRYIVW